MSVVSGRATYWLMHKGRSFAIIGPNVRRRRERRAAGSFVEYMRLNNALEINNT